MPIDDQSLTAILDSISQPVLLFRKGRILAGNRALWEWLGYAEPYPQRVFALLHESMWHRALKMYWFVYDEPSSTGFAMRFQPYDSHVCYGTVRLQRAPFAGDEAWMATISDISSLPAKVQTHQFLFESLPIGILRSTWDGTIVYANPKFLELMGFANTTDFQTLRSYDFFENPQERQMVLHVLESQDHYEGEHRYKRPNGEVFWGHVRAQVLRGEQGQPLYIQGIVLDIHEHRIYQSALEQRNRELEIFNAITHTLGTEADVRSILEQILAYSQKLIPFETASFALVEDEFLKIAVTHGFANGINLEGLAIKVDEALGLRYSTRRAVRIADVRIHPSWKKLEGDYEIRSWMGVPIYTSGETLGVLNFDHSSVDYFSEQHAQIAESVAQQVAFVLYNMRLIQRLQAEVQERKHAQETLMQNLINTQTLYWVLDYLIKSDSFSEEGLNDVLTILTAAQSDSELALILFDRDQQTLLHCLRSDGLENHEPWALYQEISAAPQLAFGQFPQQVLALEEGLALRLASQDYAYAIEIDRFGLLVAVRAAGVGHFQEAEKEVLVTVAKQLTIASQNFHLRQRLKRQNQDLEKIVQQRTQELELSNERLEAIFNGTADGIFYMEDYCFHYANQAFCQLVGYDVTELFGKPLAFVRILADDHPLNFKTVFEASETLIEPSNNEARFRHRDGSEIYTQVRFSLLGNLHDRPIKMVAIVRDISQEREIYQQRARFIANAAHELRTPLSSLGLRLHMLRSRPENVERYLESLDKTYAYLVKIVEELLDLSRFERDKIDLTFEECLLQDLLTEAIEYQRAIIEEHAVEVEIEGKQQVRLYCDKRRMVQSLTTLIGNGIYNCSDNGKIILQLEENHSDSIPHLALAVIDNGETLESKLLPHKIFEPFARPSEGGHLQTGMGLALAREIILLHSGSISAENNPDKGSRITVYLPLRTQA